ncbi:MAG: PAS domain-containing protein [Mariprofundaceae bacterium]|nr:PAS domain-containing protein [Mariprofundaceae bacterium]
MSDELAIVNWSGEILDHISTPIAYMDYSFRMIRVNQAFADFHHKAVPFFSDRLYFSMDPQQQREAMFREAIARWKQTDYPEKVSVQHSYWRLATLHNHEQQRCGLLLTMEPSLPKAEAGIPEPTVTLSDRHTRKFQQFSLREQGVIFQTSVSGLIEVSEGDCLALPEFSHGLATGRNIFDLFQSCPEMSHALYRASEGSVVRDVLSIHGVQLDVFLAPYYDNGGRVVGLIGVAIDANERQQYELRLIHAKQFLTDLLDSIPDLIYYKDQEGHYLGCNRAFANFVGLRKKTVLGKTDRHVFSVERSARLKNLHQQVLQTVKPHSLTDEGVDCHGYSHRLETHETPLQQDDSQCATIGISRKIHRRKSIDDGEELRVSPILQGDIFESGPAMLVRHSCSAEHDYAIDFATANIQQLLQQPAKMLLQSSWASWLHDEDKTQVLANLAQLNSACPHVEHAPFRVITTQGETRWVRAYSAAIYNTRGQASHCNTLLLNITAERMHDFDFYQHQKMATLGVMVDGVAHDFNNKLTGLVGHLYLAGSKLVEQSDVAVHIRSAEWLCSQASEMIKQMMVFARQDTLAMTALTINPIIREMVKLHRAVLSERVSLTCTVSKKPMLVIANAAQLQQVLMNLLNNAYDATIGCAGAHILVELNEHRIDADDRKDHPFDQGQEVARLRVSDNGHGMTEDELQSIFEPFYTTKHANKDTGLGLTMVQSVIAAHHGVITVESTIDRGTMFHIDFPLVHTETETPTTIKPTPHGHGACILVADDDSHTLIAVSQMLEHLGYRVIQARNGEQAIALYRKHQLDVDLLLLDVVMPVMGGDRAARLLREKHPDVRIVFTTGYDPEKPPYQMTVNGSMLHKPYRPEELSQVIQLALQDV